MSKEPWHDAWIDLGFADRLRPVIRRCWTQLRNDSWWAPGDPVLTDQSPRFFDTLQSSRPKSLAPPNPSATCTPENASLPIRVESVGLPQEGIVGRRKFLVAASILPAFAVYLPRPASCRRE